MAVVTRFAPSPTGYLHVGGLRTALYNYLYARRHGGKMLLRVEDTDRERFVPGSVESLIRTMRTVGIGYDEGPFLEKDQIVEHGENGPYVQSQRLPLYRQHADALLASGNAYPCFCTRERLDELRKRQMATKQHPRYDRACLGLSAEDVEKRLAAGEAHVVRMKVPEGKMAFEDAVRGRVEIAHEEVDDQVLIKSDGFPTYHLAVVVDDHAMEVTHVIRAEEWLSSTPKHLLLYAMFGWKPPVFAHIPLILNPDKSKLSKRQGDVAVEDYLAKGYLPEALINFVALLGFNPTGDREIYAVEELIEAFALEKVNKSGAVFDVAKLKWMNGEYIRKASDERLRELMKPFLEGAGIDAADPLTARIVAVEKGRLETLAELPERIRGYQESPYDAALLVWKKSSREEALERLRGARGGLEAMTDADFASTALIEAALKRYIELNGLKNGPVLWPLRVALSGKEASPSPFELAWVFGKTETLRRVDAAIAALSS